MLGSKAWCGVVETNESIFLTGSTHFFTLSWTRFSLAPSRDVFALDMRNHGASPHIMEMSYSSMTNDVRRFMDDEGIHSACLIGHSMGGKVGMQLALEDPERVSELVVVDIAPMAYDANRRQKEAKDGFSKASDPSIAVRAMRAVDFALLRQKKDVEAALEANGVTLDRVRQFLMTNLVPDEHRPGHYKWRLNICAIADAFSSLNEFVPDGKDTYNGASCFVRGGKSPFVPDESIPLIKKMFPKAQIVTIADAAHWLQADKPDEFCQALNSFLPETSGSASGQ